MSTSAVSNTDLFLSKPYHQPVNSWVKTNLDVSPFTLTNVRGIHHLALFEKTGRLWAKQKKFLNSIFTESSEYLKWVVATACTTFKGKRPLPFTVWEYYLRMTLTDWLNFGHCHKQWSYRCAWMSHGIKSESHRFRVAHPSLWASGPRVNKSLWVKLLLLVKTWNSKNPGRINSEPPGSSTCESTSGGVPSRSIRLHQSWQSITLTVCACTVHVCWSLPANIPVKWNTAV